MGQPCAAPGEGDVEVPVAAVGDGAGGDELALVLRGHALAAADRRIVEAFAAQAALALRQERLAEEAAAARPLAEADRMRTALLAAVSHDLRTPLASAKAAVTSLRSRRCRSPTTTATSCWPPPTSRWTGSAGWWPTCST